MAGASNRFSILQVDENEMAVDSDTVNVVTATQKKVKIPPIVFPKLQKAEIDEAMEKLNVTVYYVKYSGIGRKLFTDTIEDFDRVINHFKVNKTEFFTYCRPDKRPIKILLSGLHSMDNNKLAELLKTEHGITCLDVKKFEPSKSRYTEQTFYILYFEKGTIKLADLRRIKSIQRTIITWSYYSNARRGPTQCHNCQLYGHGSSNCNLPTKCQICSISHKTTDCQYAKLQPDLIRSFLKCANCNLQHLASDPTCPKRQEYLNAVRGAASRRNHSSYRQPTKTAAVNHFNNESFPPLKLHGNSNLQQSASKSNFEPSRTSFSHAVRNGLPTTNSRNTINNASNLFSPEQMIELSAELITNLSDCKSRTDQFNVIVNLAVKFLYGP